MVSCSKKYNYSCHTDIYGQASGNGSVIDKTCTESAINRYIKNNTVDKDGSPDILSQGEKITTCVKK